MVSCLPMESGKETLCLPLLIIHWVALMAFITYRMARLLELVAW